VGAEDLRTETNEIAIKRVIAWQLQQEIISKQMTKTSVAKAMGTSRAPVDRLLDPENTFVTPQNRFIRSTYRQAEA
jgi:antitoxin HicB